MEFLTLNTLTQLSSRTSWIDVVSKRFKITCLTPTVNRIWLCLRQRSCFLARSVIVLYLHLFRFVSTRDFSHPKILFSRFEEKECSCIHQTAFYTLQNVLKSDRWLIDFESITWKFLKIFVVDQIAI